MIKVVHVIDGLGWAGMEHMVASLVCRIDKKRFQVTLLSEIPMKESVKDQVILLENNGVNVRFLQKTGRKKLLVIDYYRLFRSLKPDIIHSHSGVWRDCCIGAVLAGVPKRYHTEHGTIFLEDNLRARLTHRFLTYFRDKVIAVSDDLRRYLYENVGLPENKLACIHNGIDEEKYSFVKKDTSKREQLGIDQKAFVIIAVGRINPVKDYETLIKSVPPIMKILGEDYDFKVVIIGPETSDHLAGGGLLGELQKLVHQLGVDSKIIFLGKRTDIPELLGVADIFVQTSLSEGISMSIMEAMSSRLPVVATDVGGNRELILNGETGLLVESRNYLAISDAILKLIKDEDLRYRMGRNGRKRIEESFSLNYMTRRYESLYLS